MKRPFACLLILLVQGLPFAAWSLPDNVSPLSDPAQLLSRQSAAQVEAAASVFRKATGRWMVVIVRHGVSGPAPAPAGGLPPGWEAARADIGIVFEASPDSPGGKLQIVDPAWQKALPAQWTGIYPQRLAEKYGAEPFERRVALSADYLATVFADKVAFVLKPRGGRLSDESLQFSRGAYVGLEVLGFFIIIFTVFRTFWPARLRDEDRDEFSNEIRRLKNEQQIW